MKILCSEIKTKEECRRFILNCERKFKDKLKSSAECTLSRNNKVITLSGPTCSGKTTTAELFVSEINRAGHNAVVLSIDDFYKDNLRRNLPPGAKPDFDSVKTIDTDYLAEFTDRLLLGKSVRIPRFNFLTGVRDGYTEYVPQEQDIYIFEGIQAVYPEVVSLFREKYTSIFICVGDSVSVNGVAFSSYEIRLLRRLVRDSLFRNATASFTLSCWESVRENEDSAIFPNAQNPDVYIDSFLEYELFMIGKFALPMLSEIGRGEPYADIAEDLSERLREIDNPVFDTSLVPRDSMFREFIGKI